MVEVLVTDPRTIAAGLTAAQKRAVRALSGAEFTHWNKVYKQRRHRMRGNALGLHEPERLGPLTVWWAIKLTPSA